jgi:predicted ATPase
MRYLSFTIEKYRGIVEPLTIDLRKRALVPIVGINECGKTTILEAIQAFDLFNDEQNSGRHLKNLDNLFGFTDQNARVSALVLIETEDWPDLRKIIAVPELVGEEPDLLADLAKTNRDADESTATGDSEVDGMLPLLAFDPLEELARADLPSTQNPLVDGLRDKQQLLLRHQFLSKATPPNQILLTRSLRDRAYSIEGIGPDDKLNAQAFAEALLGSAPYVFYFDDFRHDVPRVIELGGEDESEWLGIVDTLFRSANRDIDVRSLEGMEPRRRKSAIALAEKLLNETLTRQWQKFNLENAQALSVALSYTAPAAEDKPAAISFDVVEKDSKGEEHYFDIEDRSKGFFWFFNFVMRLEFNAKTRLGSGQTGAIYLLDEPGSYLHASAQTRLCRKLVELSHRTPVIYCTHSHHLLEPTIIPIANVLIVEKNSEGQITAARITQSDESTDARRLAFQPIYEALQLAPTSFEFSGRKVLVAEGLYDFFSYNMFKPEGMLVVPSVGANSVSYVVSLLLAYGADYRALWDNDAEGIKSKALAAGHFGEEEERRRFRLLPLAGGKKRILQSLFDGDELSLWREKLSLPSNSAFTKVIMALYYAADRDELLIKHATRTAATFLAVMDEVWRDP